MANSVSKTGESDKRNTEPHIKPVWEQEITFLVEVGGGHAELTYTVLVNGFLMEAVIEVGTTAQGSETVNVDFDDNNGVEFSANASLAESSETSLSFGTKPVDDFIIRVDPGDDPDSGADWEIKITCKGV